MSSLWASTYVIYLNSTSHFCGELHIQPKSEWEDVLKATIYLPAGAPSRNPLPGQHLTNHPQADMTLTDPTAPNRHHLCCSCDQPNALTAKRTSAAELRRSFGWQWITQLVGFDRETQESAWVLLGSLPYAPLFPVLPRLPEEPKPENTTSTNKAARTSYPQQTSRRATNTALRARDPRTILLSLSGKPGIFRQSISASTDNSHPQDSKLPVEP